jgi:hypothetical protein
MVTKDLVKSLCLAAVWTALRLITKARAVWVIVGLESSDPPIDGISTQLESKDKPAQLCNLKFLLSTTWAADLQAYLLRGLMA